MTISSTKVRRFLKALAAAAFWLLIWQALAMLLHEELLLSSPLSVFKKLLEMAQDTGFYRALWGSFWRITLGFFLSAAAGIFFAAISYLFPLFKTIFSPFMSVLKATPVVSFIVLAIILFGSEHIATPISFMMVLPIIYANTLAGMENTDRDLLEMASVFHVPLWRKLRYIILPSVMPFFISGSAVAIGMCWKSGVAAEVIGLSKNSLGRKIYDTKIYLNTAELFAYTLVIIVLSVIFEKLFLWAMKKLASKIEWGGKINE